MLRLPGRHAALPRVADCNGDGYADLAVIDYGSASLTQLSSLGDGVFRSTGATASTPPCIHTGMDDVNRNGRPHLVLTNTNGGSPAAGNVLPAK